MTNKQYEHLGRAMMIAADLAQGVEALSETRRALADELAHLMPKDSAEQMAKGLMSEYMPSFRLGEILKAMANAVAEGRDKMNIIDIMNRDIEAARRETERGWEARRLAELTARREKIAKAVNAAVWTVVLILALVAAFVAGYWKCGKDDLARQAAQEREWAEQDKRIEAEVRAMSNAELIAATEKIAAKYRKTKTGETH